MGCGYNPREKLCQKAKKCTLDFFFNFFTNYYYFRFDQFPVLPQYFKTLTNISDGGLLRVGRTYTVSAGKSPFSPVLSQRPTHHPEFCTVSPVLPSSSRIRSPRWKLRNEDPSPVKITVKAFGVNITSSSLWSVETSLGKKRPWYAARTFNEWCFQILCNHYSLHYITYLIYIPHLNVFWLKKLLSF